MKDVELTQIVTDVQRDNGQFELLYSQIINKVYFWCYTVLGNDADAKDMAQEAMIRIYKNISKLKEPENFTSWMYVIVRNTCYNYLKYHKKETKISSESEESINFFESNIKEERRYVLPKEAYDLKQTKKLVAQCINELPRKQREAISLFYLDEFKIEEISKLLECPIGSVKSRLHDGRKNLQAKLSSYQEENNIKLYNIALLPLLGLILQEYQNELSSKQDLKYYESLYENGGSTAAEGLTGILTTKFLIIFGSILLAVIIGATSLLLPKEDVLKPHDLVTENPMYDIEMYNKLKEDPYIEDINYLTFPTKYNIDVSIVLKQDISEDEVKILFDKQELMFRKEGNKLIVQINHNGEYSIFIKGEKILFTIDCIDENAPEFIGVLNYKTYIQLNIYDELSQLDYKKSYIEHADKRYVIGNDLRVDGEFKGLIKITLFHKDGRFIKYSINLE